MVFVIQTDYFRTKFGIHQPSNQENVQFRRLYFQEKVNQPHDVYLFGIFLFTLHTQIMYTPLGNVFV